MINKGVGKSGGEERISTSRRSELGGRRAKREARFANKKIVADGFLKRRFRQAVVVTILFEKEFGSSLQKEKMSTLLIKGGSTDLEVADALTS